MASEHVHVYKICEERDWRGHATLPLSADDRRDGFIHLSTAAQVPGTLQRHFAAKRDLVLLAFAAGDLGERLRWEPSRGGALFPHLYGDLELRLVRWAARLPADQGGHPSLPDSWREDGELDPGDARL